MTTDRPRTNAELAALRDQQPAYPAGPPDDRWTTAELRNFIDAFDALTAAPNLPVVTAHTSRKVRINR